MAGKANDRVSDEVKQARLRQLKAETAEYLARSRNTPEGRLYAEYRKQFDEEPPNDVFIMRLGSEKYLRLMKKVMKTGDKSHWYENYPWDIINDPNKLS